MLDMNDGLKERFSVRVLPEKYYMEVCLIGFFSENDMAAFLDALDAGRRKLPLNSKGKRRSFYDLSEFRLQTQNVVGLFTELANDPAKRPDRLAIYVGCSAVKMQVTRGAPPYAQLFTDKEEARQWLWQDIGA
jgi:hypothetical protein